MLRLLGAERVIDYNREDFTRTAQPFDVIMDVIGKSSLSRSLRALTPHGRYLLVNLGLSQRLRARGASTGGRQVIHGAGSHQPQDLLYLKDLIEAGQLRPFIDRQYPLEQLAEAHRYVDQGHKRGNFAVTV
jgi:NADPH:quinone reductase-like Zn-dependent oxidoreductase